MGVLFEDFSRELASRTGMTIDKSAVIVSEFVNIIRDLVTGGAEVKFHNLGTIRAKHVKRQVRNPGTGEKLMFDGYVPEMLFSRNFKKEVRESEQLNGKGKETTE